MIGQGRIFHDQAVQRLLDVQCSSCGTVKRYSWAKARLREEGFTRQCHVCGRYEDWVEDPPGSRDWRITVHLDIGIEGPLEELWQHWPSILSPPQSPASHTRPLESAAPPLAPPSTPSPPPSPTQQSTHALTYYSFAHPQQTPPSQGFWSPGQLW